MTSTVETARDIPDSTSTFRAALGDLRRRVAATNWRERDRRGQSQGVPLAMIQRLARYWMTDCDWRTSEAADCRRWRAS
ncbi:epoxide hydrolase N-terminal domain-containing protein [Candidatus Solirubrobacter pratensis]|uniref:epoxide hydrolase N-terminal domain-containing protein n=1 Tax=Candidatus Solirubrobacter pratensis TaxID=1298857 RepID=UPI0009DBFCB9